jgi:sugar/nucleoside kinase (ribokinase family)
LEELKMTEVGCAGIVVADTICGPIERLPRSGELLSVGPMPSKIGGCASNVAIDLAKQGVATEICATVGEDSAAEMVLRSLKSAGVGCGQVRRVATHPTSMTLIILVEGEDRRFLHNFGANAVFDVGQIRRDWIDSLKVFYLGGLFAMPAVRAEELKELLKYCRQRGVTSIVDVVVPPQCKGLEELSALLPYIDYFLPNDDEGRLLTGAATPEEQIEIYLHHGVGGVVVTCGPNGSIAARQGQCWKADAYRVKAIDGSGSGDAFAAGFITGILRQWDMPQTLRYAAALGASATTAIGTTDGVFTAEKADAFLAANPLNVVPYSPGK